MEKTKSPWTNPDPSGVIPRSGKGRILAPPLTFSLLRPIRDNCPAEGTSAAAEPDAALMRRVQRGDVGAFEQIVERYKGVVYALALGMLRLREDAEEAAQDTFVKLFRARATFDLSRPLEPWLLRIAGNSCRDRLRRRRSGSPPGRSEACASELADLLADERAEIWRAREATSQAVRHALGSLSDRLRSPLLLKYMHGLTNEQVSAALGISISNVKVRLARAKDVLQGRLHGALED